KRRFLVYSEMIRRTGEQRRSHQNSLAPWGAGMTMEKFMHQQVTLIGAKTSGSKLSSSKETQIVTRTEANLNCKEVRSLIQQDFRETAVWLGAQEGEEEKLCLICAERCLASRFDSHAQQLRMTMTDAAGNHADLRVNYRKETKEFIEQLEHIGKLMLEKPETPYVWLCSTRFEGGELVFFPIEVFNFIEPPPPKPFHLPPQYTAKENAKAPLILELFDEITEYMGELVQCGIQSAQDGSGRRLAKKAEQCGMEGLSGLITELGTQAEGFRHSMHSGTAAALTALMQLQRYLSIGRRKSAVITALNSMQSKL
nr:hypothetical protein [Oscillospiraceae bacterium]